MMVIGSEMLGLTKYLTIDDNLYMRTICTNSICIWGHSFST